MNLKIIVGLGNPEPEYKNTRHNAGFECVKSLRKKLGFPLFRFEKKFNDLISKGKIKNQNLLLVLPQTYMNNSGEAVKKIMDYYKIPLDNLIVVHDEIDLPLGSFKESFGRGSAGHKGVKSVIEVLGSKNFVRFRIGIRPEKESGIINYGSRINVEKFVLEKFKKKEKEIIKKIIQEIINESLDKI